MQINYVETDIEDRSRDADASGRGADLISAVKVIGSDVHSVEGIRLGTVTDIMIDALSGLARYAVLSVGGFLGVGDKLAAVPLQALRLDGSRQRFTLPINNTAFTKAPTFGKEHWPQMTDPGWILAVNRFYGTNEPESDLDAGGDVLRRQR